MLWRALALAAAREARVAAHARLQAAIKHWQSVQTDWTGAAPQVHAVEDAAGAVVASVDAQTAHALQVRVAAEEMRVREREHQENEAREREAARALEVLQQEERMIDDRVEWLRHEASAADHAARNAEHEVALPRPAR